MLTRAEAFPLSWDLLTDGQRKVVTHLAKLFGELADEPWEPPPKQGAFDRFFPRVDIDRHNHVALIEGERGMGKTVVLLTLLAAWGAKERADPLAHGRPISPDGVLRGRVIPVGLVDLQPLPPGTNLLVHLAGQLSRLVDALDENGAGASTRHDAWNPNKSAEPTSRRHWRAFVQAAAAGWDGRLDARRASLDPEAFALEFEEAERHRLDVRERFRDLVDALVEEYPKVFAQQRGTPFFVISVDDADMNPDRGRELLDLVRTLWHPRVGFLLTGHDKLFLDVLKASLNKATPSSNTSEHDALSNAIYDKAIPPYQRFSLSSLPISERRRLLSDTLREVPIFDHPLKPSNLLDYLEVNRLTAIILPNNLRQLRDWEVRVLRSGISFTGRQMWHRFRGRDDQFGSFFVRLSGPDASDMEIAGDVTTQEDIYDRGLSSYSMYVMIEQDARGFGVDARVPTVLGRTIRGDLNFGWPAPRWRSWLDYASFVRLLRSVFELRVTEVIEDLSYEYRWSYGQSTNLFNREDVLRAFLTWAIRFMEFRRERAKQPRGTLREALDLLLQRWGADILGWEHLARRLDEVANDSEMPAEDREWASVSVGLLAAPEHRLPVSVANLILKRIKARHAADWRDITATLRDLRTKAAAKTDSPYGREKDKTTPEPASVLAEIDAQSSRYDWVLEVSRIELPNDELLRLLNEFLNQAPANQGLRSLAEYFDPERWRIIQRQMSDDLRKRWMEKLGNLPRGGLSASTAATVMWNEAIRAGAAPELSPLEGVPRAADLHASCALHGIDPWGFQEEGAALDLGALRLKPASLEWRESTGFRGTLSGVLFESLWDIVSDVEDRESAKAHVSPLSWWHPIGTRRDDSRGISPWPFPEWLTFLDYRIFASSYNEQLSRIRKAMASLPAKHDVSANLAVYYVKALRQLAERRKIQEQWDASVIVPTWDFLLQWKQRPGDGARWVAFHAWVRRLPLLAAPESGLGADTAKSMLDAYNASPEEKEILRKTRRERLHHLGLAEEQITAELAGIDAQHEGHPWIQLLGAVT